MRELAGRAARGDRPGARRPRHDAGRSRRALTDKVTAERDEELRVFLSEPRLVKDEFEIGELQKAVDSTVRGFEDVVKVLDKAEATSERYIEGTFFLRARVEGNDIGYGSICAAGPHATTLHWVRNDGAVRSGELLLLDAGVETHTLYTADVTRTLPINGRFTDAPAQDLRRGVRGAGGRHRGREAGRASTATSTTPRSACSPRSSSSGAWSRARSSACWSWASSAAGRCTAPATCSAWTCTTAPPRAPRRTSTAPWSRACA